MTGLLIGCAIGAYIAFKLGYYDHVITTLIDRGRKPPLPSPNHLSCGECIWLLPAAFPENRTPDSLCDQLIISPFCTVHNTFAHKRWNERHLDDKGLRNPWQTDVDNYRGSFED